MKVNEKRIRRYPASYDAIHIEAAERLHAPFMSFRKTRQHIYVADRDKAHMFYPRRRNVYTFAVKGYAVVTIQGRVTAR